MPKLTKIAHAITATGLMTGGLAAAGAATGTTPALAGTNGQQLCPYSMPAWTLDTTIKISGHNQSGHHASFYGDDNYSGWLCTYGWWWKGVVLVRDYTYNSAYVGGGYCGVKAVNYSSNYSWCYLRS